jgi:uncharacterized protein (DUF1330 family)
VAAYFVVNVEVRDPEGYKEYTSQTPGTVDRYGGRFVARGGTVDVLEGQWDPKRVVLIEFPDRERALEWYHSAEYQAIIPLREKYATTHFLALVDGV